MIRHVPWRGFALAALLIWAPLPFASVTPAGSIALLLASLGALALALWSAQSPLPPRTVLLAAAAIAAIAVGGYLQSRQWPAGLVGVLSPRHAELTEQAAEITRIEPHGVRLSLAPGASRAAALDWLIPAAALLAAGWIGASRRVRRLLGGALLLSAAAQIALALQQWVSQADTLWGVRVPGTGSRLHGSFVNPNHFALFLEIALPVAFAWAWWAARRTLDATSSAERRLLAVGPPLLVLLLLAGGLVLTGSRAGLVAALIAVGLQALWITGRRGRRWLVAGGAAALATGGLLIALVGLEGAFARLLATPLDEVGGGGRMTAAAATLRLWGEFPWTGSGLGTFRAAFPLVQPESIPGLWRHAHSDWLELGATAGALGFAIGLAGLYVLLRRLARVLRQGERSEDRAAALAALGAAIAVGLHSFADFGLTMPANAFALAVLLGAAAAAPTADEARRANEI